jgi:hypothetical protein
MTKQFIVTVLAQDRVIEFRITASSRQQAYDRCEAEWDRKHGKGDFDKYTVGVNGEYFKTSSIRL